MAALRKIKWRREAFEEIRRSTEVTNQIAASTDAIAAQAGQLYGHGISRGRTRNRGSVWTGSYKARVDNAKHNTLLRALNSGAGRP